MTEQKRVYCLYRVSTAGQVEKDDIPMQKKSCREFAKAQGWEIVDELYEKGVSGFKVSAKDRDAIVEIQKDAALKKFDILLVFMFDRIGRKEDETPFIVEWFVNEGIEVWSVNEGQQRFDTHVDKLMNYIRYWQASGESIKTSVRTKTSHGQMVQEGRFRGGTPPYGFRLEKQGRMNKKNHEVNEILIDEDESFVVKKIFDLYVTHGYGSQRIASYLIEHSYYNRSGTNFTNTTIQHMLKNMTYVGILKSGETVSEIFKDLQIIDPEIFITAQELIKQRSIEYKERNKPLNTKGSSLLSGNVFCGHCGARLSITTNGKKYIRKDGTVRIKPRTRYVCYNKTRHPHLCDGQTGYTAQKLDAIIDEIVHGLFEKVDGMPKDTLVKKRFSLQIQDCKKDLGNAKSALKQNLAEMQDYEKEVIKIIRGESNMNQEMLNKLYEQSKTKADYLKQTIKSLEEKIANSREMEKEISKQFDNLRTWSDMYDNCEMDTKKMILSQIMSAVKVSRDYNIEIDLNVQFEELGIVELEENKKVC